MKKQPKSTNYNFLTYSVLVVVVIMGLLFLKSKLTNPKVAEVATQKVGACSDVVTKFSGSGYCGNGKVKMIYFTCANGKGSGIDGVKDCIDPVEGYKYAQDFCGNACVGSTAKPVAAPSTPSSTCTCPAGVKCKLPSYCNPGSTAKPVAAPSFPSSTCTCPPGAACKLPAYCNKPNPNPVVPPPIN